MTKITHTHRRVITAKYIPPTDLKASRIRVSAGKGSRVIYRSYHTESIDPYDAAALDYLERPEDAEAAAVRGERLLELSGRVIP